MKLGYVLTCFAFALLGLCSYQSNFWLVYLAMVTFAFGAMSNPTEMAVVSQCVPATVQGKLQAANGCLDVIGKLMSSLMVFLLFEPMARAGQPGVIWWIASIVLLPGVLLSFRIQRLLPESYGQKASVAEDMNAHVDADDSLASNGESSPQSAPGVKLQCCITEQDLIPVVVSIPEAEAAVSMDVKCPPDGSEPATVNTFACFWKSFRYSLQALGLWSNT